MIQFSLETDEIESITKTVLPWKMEVRSNMVIEISLQDASATAQPPQKILIEQWTLSYASR